MTAKARGKKSVLSRQKPKKARQKQLPLKQRVRRWAIGGCVVLGLGGAVWGAWRLRKLGNDLTIAMAGSPTQWHVKPKAFRRCLRSAIRRKTISLVPPTACRSRHARRLDESCASRAAAWQLRRRAYFEALWRQPRGASAAAHTASVYRGRPPQAHLYDREVYGQVDQNLVANCPGAVVSGVFDPGLRLPMRSDLTLSLSDDESALVHEAVQLSREAHEHGFAISRMESKRFRGFLVTLAGQDTEVAIGRAPFAGKLERLQTILARQAAKGQQAQRIELDYQGKAFIKLKKM